MSVFGDLPFGGTPFLPHALRLLPERRVDQGLRKVGRLLKLALEARGSSDDIGGNHKKKRRNPKRSGLVVFLRACRSRIT